MIDRLKSVSFKVFITAFLFVLMVVFMGACDDKIVLDPVAKLEVELIDNKAIFSNLSEGYTDAYWDFGDGSSSSEKAPAHVYEEAGTYLVNLVVTGGELSDTASIQVTVLTLDQYPISLSTIFVTNYQTALISITDTLTLPHVKSYLEIASDELMQHKVTGSYQYSGIVELKEFEGNIPLQDAKTWRGTWVTNLKPETEYFVRAKRTYSVENNSVEKVSYSEIEKFKTDPFLEVSAELRNPSSTGIFRHITNSPTSFVGHKSLLITTKVSLSADFKDSFEPWHPLSGSTSIFTPLNETFYYKYAVQYERYPEYIAEAIVRISSLSLHDSRNVNWSQSSMIKAVVPIGNRYIFTALNGDVMTFNLVNETPLDQGRGYKIETARVDDAKNYVSLESSELQKTLFLPVANTPHVYTRSLDNGESTYYVMDHPEYGTSFTFPYWADQSKRVYISDFIFRDDE